MAKMRDSGNVGDEQRARLQKALSQAYLSHQISELESKVNAISLPPQPPPAPHRTSGSAPAWAPLPPAASAHARSQLPAAQVGMRKLGRIDDSQPDYEAVERALSSDDSEADERDREWRVSVLDVSALLWAPKAVRKLVGLGGEVIVPSEAIRTLDLLKKGDHPSATQARAAARYIEHATRHHRLLSSDPSITVQEGTNYKRGVGMRIQCADEVLEPASIMLVPVPGDLPRWISSVLSCAAYFERIARAEDTDDGEGLTTVLCVANPPLSVPPGEQDSHVERGEGALVSEQAARFELGLEVLRDDDEEIGRGFGGRERGGGRGRGRGRGGGGGRGGDGSPRGGTRDGGGGGGRGRGGVGRGTRQKEEPEREVKILLRRPQSDTERVASGSPNTETSPLPATVLPTDLHKETDKVSPRLAMALPLLPLSPKHRPRLAATAGAPESTAPVAQIPGEREREPRLFDPASGQFHNPPEHMHHQHHHQHSHSHSHSQHRSGGQDRAPSEGHNARREHKREGAPSRGGREGRGGRGSSERGRGRGRGRGGGGGGRDGPRNGEFVLLQRPAPPEPQPQLQPESQTQTRILARPRPPPAPTPAAAVPDSSRRMVLLQRPK